jgi:hypothetical protein
LSGHYRRNLLVTLRAK